MNPDSTPPTPRRPDARELTPTLVHDLEETGDALWWEGAAREVTAVEYVDGGAVRVEFDADPDTATVFPGGTTLPLIDPAFFYLTAEEGMARNPGRMSEEEFYARFHPVHDASGSVPVFDDVPEDVPEEYLWTQVEGDSDGPWRDFALLPGVHRVNALNYLVCATPWTEADAEVEVNWN